MKLPRLFRQIHGDQIFRIWVNAKSPPMVRIVPREPLGCVLATSDGMMPNNTVTLVTVRCWNDSGTLQFEAATPADFEVAREWAERHKCHNITQTTETRMPFTVVFAGDVTEFKDNPFDFKSDFGKVVGISKQDLIAENERLRLVLADIAAEEDTYNYGHRLPGIARDALEPS